MKLHLAQLHLRNFVSRLKCDDISYKTTLYLFSFDFSFTSDSRSNMEFINAEIRAVFFFVQNKTARKSHRQINGVVRDGIVSIRTAEEWFRRFRAGQNDTIDPIRPIITDVDKIIEKIHEHRHVTIRSIAGELQLSTKTVHRHLKAGGYTRKLDTWVPHELSKKT